MRLEERLTDDFGYFVDCEQLIERRVSPFQTIEIARSATLGNLLRLDGAIQCSERDECLYHEPLVHMAMCSAKQVARVVVIGGGDGGAAEEVLKWPAVRQLQHVEIDQDVIDLCRLHLYGVHNGVLDGIDPRYHLTCADGVVWLRAACERGERFDVVVLDLTDEGGASTLLYTSAFWSLCRQVLAPGGVLALHLAAPWTQRERAVRYCVELHGVFPTVRPFMTSVLVSGGQWLMAVCGDALDPHLDAGEASLLLGSLSQPALEAIDAHVLASASWLPPYFANSLQRAVGSARGRSWCRA